MSFMFSPFPYDDLNAVNHVNVSKNVTNQILTNNELIKKELTDKLFDNANRVLVIDGYPTCNFNSLVSMFENVKTFNMRDIYKNDEEIHDMLKAYLPEDRVMDPVLLYGKLFTDGLKKLMDENKLNDLLASIKNESGKVIVYGHGALIKEIRALADIKIYMDVSPKEAAIRAKKGLYINIGDKKARPFKELMRRNYYVDFENETLLRKELVQQNELDYYVFGDHDDALTMAPFGVMNVLFDELVKRPFRCKPVYLEGVWGGFYMMRMRNLPKTMKNCAWIFDMIPSEVSVVIESNATKIEVPYYTFVHARGVKLMGQDCVDYFHGYFPIRFNYDDTWHANGNMSIQCHPYHDYVRKENNELGRQDESYYIVEAAEGAKTFLGFNEDINPDDFMKEVFESEKTGKPIDYLKYVNAVTSTPGTQVLIPAGTIHSSGRNQLVLEIGSLTIGSYTYKLYDYMRKDLDGNPRPIHSRHGDNVLQKYRKTNWVNEHIVRRAKGFDDHDTVLTQTVGESPLLYFKLMTTQFLDKYEDNTKNSFHVLTVTNGEKVRISSKNNPEYNFVANYLDIVVVPQNVGEYVVENLGNQPVTIHKTLLREDFLDEFNQYEKALSEK